MEPKVSVIIPTLDRKDDLRVALRSIFKTNYKNYEVIVIDDGSSDDTSQMVKSEFPKVILIRNKENKGTSLAKNLGIIRCKGDYLLFCDSDIEMYNKNSIKNMVKILQENTDIGAVGGEAYKFSDGNVVTKKRMITPNCETRTVVIKKDKYYLEPCGYVATCNCMMPRKLVFECGGFDSDIVYSGEDKEIGIKLKKKGYRSVVDSRCLVYHYVGETQTRRFYLFNKNRIRVVIKNYPWWKILVLPLLDILSFFDPVKFKDIKKEKVDIIKYQKNKKGKLFIWRVVQIGSKYIISVIAAYVWNLIFLPQNLSKRIRNVNYLEELNERIKKK